LKSIIVKTKSAYLERNLREMGIRNRKQLEFFLKVIIENSKKEGYIKILKVYKLSKYENGDEKEIEISYQKKNFDIKIKTIKKGDFIEISNKPFYDKTRVFI